LVSYVDDNLVPGEEVAYRGRLHWIIFLVPAAFLVLGIVFLVVWRGRSDLAVVGYIGGLCLGIALVVGLSRTITFRSSEFAVTSKRVLIKVGFVRRHSLELLLQKVEGIGVDQDVGGRIFGYGTITVTGTGGTRETFNRIAAPLEFRRQVQARVAQ
jgi:uncharacterized membrane protein YdbT with pleckstrin-like domain